MTVLSAIQKASIRLTSRKPQTIYSSTDTFAIEMQDMANVVADDIAKSHDWQVLTRVHTLDGDGSIEEFPLPDDYARMLVKSDVYDGANFAWGYHRVVDINEFLWLRRDGVQPLPGAWTIYGGSLQFVPAPGQGQSASFPYISKNYARSADSLPIAEFSQDTDEFLLPERLLTLGIIWRWRQNKGLKSDEDETNFGKAFAEETGRDKGSRIIRTGRLRVPASVSIAYPFALGPQ